MPNGYDFLNAAAAAFVVAYRYSYSTTIITIIIRLYGINYFYIKNFIQEPITGPYV